MDCKTLLVLLFGIAAALFNYVLYLQIIRQQATIQPIRFTLNTTTFVHNASMNSASSDPVTKAEVVVVRTHFTSLHRASRWIQWAQELRNASSRAQFWISIDQTNADYHHTRLLHDQIRLHNLPADLIRIHEYNLSHVDALYKTHWMVPFPRWQSPLYFGHVEPLLTFLHEAGYFPHNLKHVWIIEDDVGFSGNLGEALHWYDKKYPSADMITTEYSHQPADWLCHDWETKEFNDIWDLNHTWWSQEFVQRISGKMMMEVEDLMINKNVSAISETFLTTVCVNGDYECKALETSHYNLSTYYYLFRISQSEQWDELRQDPSRQNQFFHALKF